MRPRTLATLALTALLGVGGSAMVAPAPQARADMCFPSMTPVLRYAVGHLFTAIYHGTERVVPGRREHRLDVDRVFAGGDRVEIADTPNVVSAGQELRLPAGGCNPMRGLRPGHRYLVSVSWLGPLTSWYGVAWELLPGGRVRLVREYGGKDMAPRLAHPKTLREAVALMLPSAHTATRRHDPAITGTCPPSPAAVAASPVPGEEPAESPAMTPTWLLALGAGGRLAAGSPCAFDTLVAWPGGYLASSHAGTGARRRLVADWVSPDAVTWTRHDPAGDSAARALAGPAVAYGDGLLRFGSDGGDLAIWSSTDGAAWSRLPDDPALRTGASWLDLQAAVSGERVLVTGTGRDRCTVLGCRERTWTWTSGDGAAWTRTDPDGRLLPRPAVPLAGWDGGFVALGDHRAVLTSADGVTWQATGRLPDDLVLTGSFAAIPGEAAVTWFTLRPLGDVLGTQVVSVQRSTDLRAWTEVAVSDGLGTWPPAIGAGPTGLTLAGADRERRPWAMTSADGSAWTPPTSSPDLSLGVPVAAAGGPAGPVLVSAGDNADGALAWRFGPP